MGSDTADLTATPFRLWRSGFRFTIWKFQEFVVRIVTFCDFGVSGLQGLRANSLAF